MLPVGPMLTDITYSTITSVSAVMQRKHYTNLQLKKFRSQMSAGKVILCSLKSRHPAFELQIM